MNWLECAGCSKILGDHQMVSSTRQSLGQVIREKFQTIFGDKKWYSKLLQRTSNKDWK